MAEYIDRNLIEWYGCDYEKDPDCENRECSSCSHAKGSHAQVMQIPTADVIERSNHLKQVKYIQDNLQTYIDNTRDKYFAMERRYNKLKADVDKAIEEIEYLKAQYRNDTYYDCKHEVLEILRKHLGE